MSPGVIGEAKLGKEASPTDGAEVGKGCAVGAYGSDSVSGVSSLLSSLLCGWFCAKKGSLMKTFPMSLC